VTNKTHMRIGTAITRFHKHGIAACGREDSTPVSRETFVREYRRSWRDCCAHCVRFYRRTAPL